MPLLAKVVMAASPCIEKNLFHSVDLMVATAVGVEM
jgi:hypothetical protein